MKRGPKTKRSLDPLYKTWQAMMQRCYNPNTPWYHRYGGRGILVCDRWHEYDNFLADVSPKPPGTSLDRIDNNSGYGPTDFRWATQKQQVRNSRSVKLIAYKGETRLLKEWTELLGLEYQMIKQRILSGWSTEDAFEKPKYTCIKGRKPKNSIK